MGKASSSKKVQRAAKAAASSRGASESRELGFPLVVALVVVLGIGLVFVARGSRDPLLSPRVGEDHWHASYTVYDCGTEVASFQGVSDPDGIHSHQDGLIHIHPFNSGSSGEDAQMGVFLEAMNATVSRDAITGPEFADIETSATCDGEPAVIKIARYQVDPEVELVAVYDRDFESIQFFEDREAYSIAMVPVGLVCAYMFYSTARNRIDAFLFPSVEGEGASDHFQTNAAHATITSGGWTGTGPGGGTVKFGLPEAHTDYIYSVIGEEFGLIACAIIALVFLAIVVRVFVKLLDEQDEFKLLAASGLAVQFGAQALVSMAVNTGLAPSKGMTLPFISYGGSSMIALSIGMGLLLAFTRRNPFLTRSPYVVRWGSN